MDVQLTKNRITPKMKIRTCSLLLAMALILALTTPVYARTAGAFAKALKTRYCQGLYGATFYGCYAYMHYRVDYATDKGKAKSYCYQYGCGKRYSGANQANCNKGCDKGYGLDTE